MIATECPRLHPAEDKLNEFNASATPAKDHRVICHFDVRQFHTNMTFTLPQTLLTIPDKCKIGRLRSCQRATKTIEVIVFYKVGFDETS